jgi:diguanylate cyclase (GGDEF)-like protein
MMTEPIGFTEGGDLEVIRDGARLAALRDLGLLGGPPPESFDRLTRAASMALGAPVSLVSLVGADRQFFVGQQGLTGELAQTRQTPLSYSFCQHAVTSRQPLIISDARKDPLLATNLAVRDLDVVAYAGVPLIMQDGAAVGAFCAIDSAPREWNDTELTLLEDLAHIAQELLDLRAAVAQEGLYDQLTGLPNRSLLVAHAEQILERSDGRLMVMCAGLDNFTQINQALGTDPADAVLRAAGERFGETLRTPDVLGRLRGDIFTILVGDIREERDALALAGRVRSSFSDRPLVAGEEHLSVSATIGIALARDGSRPADLISEAVSAMRQAKRHHTRTKVARDDYGRLAATQLRLRDAMRGAVERGEISVAYQPMVDLDSGRVIAYEALARWHHPELGEIAPAQFIPVAEATADIIAIGEWILEQSCTQLSRWRQSSEPNLGLSVNLAPLQLEQPNLTEIVSDILRRTGIPGEALTLEITEGVLLESASIQHDNLQGLRRLGIRIALDDFGTGYSALAYLKRFPIDIIKIDRSFISGMEEQRYDTALIQAILAMAKGMDLDLVAEGIETAGQRQLLRLLGCHYGQGFLFARPAPADEAAPDATF